MAALQPAQPFANASLYVGDLNPDVTEALLFEIFNAVGPVASVRVCRDAATRRSLGYSYVNFHRVEDAERALDTMNFKPIRNRPCRIMWSHRDPQLRKSGVGNIFVKNLARTIDNKTLYDTFSMFGNILSCKVCNNSKTGESLGYGFVHYESDEAARNAILKVDGKIIAESKVSVASFKSKKERQVEQGSHAFTNVYVKSLPEECSEEQVKELFEKHGTITSMMISKADDGKLKGFGFINYEAPEAAVAAIEGLNGYEWGEKKLVVCRAQKKEEREKELREKYESAKMDRQKKYAGVNLYVKNLADDLDDDKLRSEFEKFGSITSCVIMKDSQGKSKGFGFVCFTTPEEATKAVTEMNGCLVANKPLYVALAQRKDQRRVHLETQYQNRAKMGMTMPVGQPQIFPGQAGGPPMFYQQGMPQRPLMYPQQMMANRRPYPSHVPHQMMVGGGVRQNGVFQLMPLNNGNPQQMQHQGRPRQQRKQNYPKGGVKNQNAQNRTPQQNPQSTPNAEPEAPAAAGPLTATSLAAAPEETRKQMIGERLYPMIEASQPKLAGKITGMLLEMDNGELLHLLESQGDLDAKINEALYVLKQSSQ